MEKVLNTYTICQWKHLAIKAIDIDFWNNKESTFEMISFVKDDYGGAIIAAYDTITKNVIMIQQFQVWYGKKTLLLPRWGKELWHNILQTAQKELLEETWYEAKKWIEWPEIYSSPWFFNQHTGVVLAFDPFISNQSLQRDEIEEIDVILLPLEDALSCIMNGSIIDARTISALFILSYHLQHTRTIT